MRSVIAATTIAILLSPAFCAPPTEEQPEVKYVFVFIGDGMGHAQVQAAEAYLAAVHAGSEQAPTRLAMQRFKAQGTCSTHAFDRRLTDSAAAATALACGKKTHNGVISMDPEVQTPYPTIVEKAQQAGMSVGIVTSVSLDHATPACYYAHTPSRKNTHEICLQLAHTPAGFDFFGGGGMVGRFRSDVDAKAVALDNGFVFADSAAALAKIPAEARVLCWNASLAGDKALWYEIDRLWLRTHSDEPTEVNQMSLADFTEQCIRQLEDDPEGFFLMVEGGKIDWACHANDAATAIRETLAFDQAIRVAEKFYQQHPQQTLVVVTADHETGGMSMDTVGAAIGLLRNQKVSHELFTTRLLARYKTNHHWRHCEDDIDADMARLIQESFGLDWNGLDPTLPDLTEKEKQDLEAAYDQSMGQFAASEELTTAVIRIINRKAGISFVSHGHTSNPVPVMAKGRGAKWFSGSYDNTDIAKKLAKILKLKLAPDGCPAR